MGDNKMTRNELLLELKEALQREDELAEETLLSGMEEWDSLSVLSIVALYDRLFSVNLKYNDISNLKSVGDLINLVQNKLEA